MDRDHFWLNDREFARLAPHLPTDTRGKPRVDDRRVISGIVHVLKSGCRWADSPLVYGPRKTLYNRFVRILRCMSAKNELAARIVGLRGTDGQPFDPPCELVERI